ncbi:MAG TPA: site-specific integrase [Ktedonobacteraceae bacterium]|nr:site-specific integrase [Ktedonobacteraceae bacterium]
MAKRGNGAGSVYRRKSDGKWVGSITLENSKRKVFYGKTQKEVQDKVNEALYQQQKGTLVTAPNEPLEDYLRRWLEDVCMPPNLRVSTYVKYKKTIETYIIPALGKVPLQKLEPLHVKRLCNNQQKRGLSPKMVGEIHGLLHKALDDAVKWGLLARNVCDLVDRPRVEKKEIPVLDKNQALALLESVKQHRLGVLLLVVLTTGMRRGELLALRWADVNLEKGALFVNKTVDYIPHYGYVENGPKSKSGRRTIKIAAFVVEILKAHREKQQVLKAKAGLRWVEKDLVFCGLTGDYFNPNYLLRLFKEVLVEAGLPHMRFHDLRHSAATILLAMGIHPKVVQELLGHSSFLITMNLYGHVFPSMLDEVVEKWNREFNAE